MTFLGLTLLQSMISLLEQLTSNILKRLMKFRYVQLNVQEPARWDESIEKADTIYEKMMHNICW